MAGDSTELREMVFADADKYNGIRKPLKASYLERCLVKKISPKKLHVNPDDEFSMREFGPHPGIVNKYVQTFVEFQYKNLPIEMEPLFVEKMSPDGYMILNGHHRWAAATKLSLKKVPIKIVNLVHEEDIEKMARRTNNTVAVAIDFDEVLTCFNDTMRHEPYNITRREYSHKLRAGVPDLIRFLQELKCDVWVYTADYLSLDEMVEYFSSYGVSVDGIINGMNGKNAAAKQAGEAMEKKYAVRYHIDNESVTFVERATRNMEQFEITGGPDDWADCVRTIMTENCKGKNA